MADFMKEIYWRPSIGDPTLLGWTTVYAYICAGILSLACAVNTEKIFHDEHTNFHRFIWSGMALGLFALGINKQLDLQTLMTDVARLIAHKQGWYEERRIIQLVFVIAIAGISGASLLILIWSLRSLLRYYWLLLFGSAALGRFVIVRAASFYGVSLPEVSQIFGGLRINWLLELLALCIIILAALTNLLRYRVE